MAAAIVSKVLEDLASVPMDEIEQRSRLLEKLRLTLFAVRPVLADAEIRQFHSAEVRMWLDKLRDVSYELEDLLDEWSTVILKSKIPGARHAAYPLREVRPLLCCFCCFRSKFGPPSEISYRMRELGEKLDAVVCEKDRFGFVTRIDIEQVERFMTPSFFADVKEVIGRDSDKMAIIEMLKSESSHSSNLQIISIVGVGGIGKTTLAQLVYVDDVMKSHFQERMWVCVSDASDVIRVGQSILESLTGFPTNLAEVEPLVHSIHQNLKEKRFLLVLDDVWEENRSKWRWLRRFLACGSRGSRILVTTRMERVAQAMDCTDIYRLRTLTEEASWSLFSRIAFYGWSNADVIPLENVGMQIVEKAQGLPLALKTLGGLLCSKKSKEEWKSILNSQLWEVEDVFLTPLLLSYFDLSPELRQCFSYCSIFPMDHVIEKQRLIELWMAQGYLRETPRKEIETVGEEYFEILAVHCFFQDFELDDFGGSIIRCKMHDIVHDLAQIISMNESFNLGVNAPVDLINKQPRHLRLEYSPSPPPCNLKKLRSLFVHSRNNTAAEPNLPELFNHLTCLRSLDLSHCDIKEIPSTIDKLMHLRQLNLSHNYQLKKLPETVCELCNLQILDVSFCRGLVELPYGIGKLVNLWHLNNEDCQVVLPKGIEKLSHLKKLDNFVIGPGHDNRACSLGDLKNLNKLRGYLSISGLENVSEVDEGMQAQLEQKADITTLELHFGEEVSGSIHDQDLLEALRPSPNLKSLLIDMYQGINIFPSWLMSLNNLRKLSLGNCRCCELLPPLGKLPSLELLVLWHMGGVKKVGIEFLGIELSAKEAQIAFPRLTDLLFLSMEEWEEWEEWDDKWVRRNREEGDTTNITIMPCLRSLLIYDCPKLRSLPDYVLQKMLQELEILDCKFLKERYEYKISHIPNIRIG